MEIVIGTYEEFLIGFKLIKKNQKFVLEQSFTNHAHNGSVRCIATSNKYLASGSIDEVIHLINIRHRVETGTLVSHTGTITALEFLRTAYLFSSSEDGNISIWSTQKWQCEKILRGHKGPVTSINLHSSGKLLLSTSKDKTLRTWNLIKGRCAYIVNLKEVAHQVLWSPTCIYFGVVFENHIDIYDISTGAIKHQINQQLLNLDKRLNKIAFINDNQIFICGNCPELIIYDTNKQKVINRIHAHQNRIKDLVLIQLNKIQDDSLNLEQEEICQKWLFTASSDRFIKIWSFDFNDLEKQPILISEIDSTCRPTCMAVWTSNEKYEKFESGFTVPELQISKEELEACRIKLKSKRKKIKLDSTEKETKLSWDSKNQMNNDQQQVNEKYDCDQDNDNDNDDEIIRTMKASSKTIKNTKKSKKNKSSNNKGNNHKF